MGASLVTALALLADLAAVFAGTLLAGLAGAFAADLVAGLVLLATLAGALLAALVVGLPAVATGFLLVFGTAFFSCLFSVAGLTSLARDWATRLRVPADFFGDGWVLVATVLADALVAADFLAADVAAAFFTATGFVAGLRVALPVLVDTAALDAFPLAGGLTEAFTLVATGTALSSHALSKSSRVL